MNLYELTSNFIEVDRLISDYLENGEEDLAENLVKANKIIDFLIFISFKCNVLSAKSLEMYCLFMSNFLVYFLIRYSL